MLKPHDEELRVSRYVFWGQTGRPQNTGWRHIWLGAHERGRDSPLNRIGLWASEENIRTLFMYRVWRLHTVSASHYSDPTEHDESRWNLWWLRASPKDFRKLCRIGKISTKTHAPEALALTSVSSVPSQNRDKTIMTQLAVAQLAHFHEWKWNWFENPASAQAGTEGIIVLIVLILCPCPPSHSNSSHHTLPSSLCLRLPFSLRALQPSFFPFYNLFPPAIVFIKKLPLFLSLSCVGLKAAQLDNPVLAERKKKKGRERAMKM